MDSCCEGKSSELNALREKHGKVLKIVLSINFAMFFIEFWQGLVAHSSALQADSLDMLGDAIVYAFSLFVLHKSDNWKTRAAFLKGILIAIFGVGVFIGTVTKAFAGGMPAFETMGWIGGLALIANLTCLCLLLRFRKDDINMKSTFICSRNDIISNVGVLVAALFVHLTASKWPDVVVGGIIAIIFLRSAWSILGESFAACENG